jgi:hypothetical protein
MNRRLFIIDNVIFLIVVILFIICTHLKLYNVIGINTILIYIILLILMIIRIVDIIRKNKRIIDDKKYSTISIISNLLIMCIILRGIFDMGIVTNVMHEYDSYGDIYRMYFVGNNLIYFNIIYICLIIYRFTLNNKKIEK